MKKRHHHKKSHGHHKMHEGDAMGHMDHAERSMHRHMSLGEEYYAGYDPRRRQEMRDAGMISEDHHALANLPQTPIMSYYSEQRYMPEVLDDTIRGVDMQIDADDRQAMKQFKPHKY